jgi:predicted phosphoribosyltransferase
VVARYFRDRSDAGRQLALKLSRYAHRPDVIVLALPRGGVPVAYEVATSLGAPLDVFLIRKLGVSGYEEFANRGRRNRRHSCNQRRSGASAMNTALRD